MKEKLLSICVPTYNRVEIFKKSFYTITEQIINTSELLIELNISVNPSGDGTEDFVMKNSDFSFMKYNINKRNIGAEKNIEKVISMASGKYIWLIGDDDLLLSNTIKNVVNRLLKYKDISWMYINYGFISDNKLIPRYVINDKDTGYKKNGKKAILKAGRSFEGGILFTSSNIYLREAVEEVRKKSEKFHLATMIYTYHSASKGSAYIIEKPLINQGPDILWKGEQYEISVRLFNEALLNLTEFNYTKRNIISLISYRMRHDAIFVWFIMIKQLFKNPTIVLKDFISYLSLIPLTTVLIIFISPLLTIYLPLRHWIRMIKRKKWLKKHK